MTRAAALLLVAAGACIPGDGPMMRPFEDCMGCHSSTGNAKAWSVAGTWRKGVTVSVTDANGKTVEMHANDAGNFYTREPLARPFASVSVDGNPMPATANPGDYGGCNACHRAETITVGPDMAPGAACLGCHGPSGMAATKLSAAGTFSPGLPVQVGSRTTTTRASSGNFFFYAATQPIAFPAPALVGGQAMEGGAPHGDCNQCHGGGRGGGD